MCPKTGEVHLVGLKKLTAMLDQADDAIMVRDSADRIIYWNQGAQDLYGWSGEQALGRVSRELLQTTFTKTHEEIQAQLECTNAWRGEQVHTTRHGRRLVVDSRWLLHRDQQGRPLSILEINRDITMRTQAEQAIMESEERYRRLFEDDLTGDYLATPQGRIIACNPSFLEIFGLASQEEALGINLASLYPGAEDFARFVDLVEKKRRLEHYQCPRRRRDGSLFHVVENVVGEFDALGRLLRIKGYLFDDTARKLGEEALIRKDREITLQLKKIEKLNAALTTLLERRDQESRQKEEDILFTVEKLVLPHLHDLKATHLDDDQRVHIEVIEGNLKNITSAFARHLATWKTKLTPSEIKVADLIRQGKNSKEVASLLCISSHAVAFHRANLRAKLGLRSTGGNLASHLRHLD
jgi:PAS domain S-box-containing protein